MTRPRPGLGEALAATRAGETLVVTVLAPLARSVPDADQLRTRLLGDQVAVTIGAGRYPPDQPVTIALLEVLALAGDLQAGVGSGRTREGLAATRSRGQLRGRPPRLSPRQEQYLVRV